MRLIHTIAELRSALSGRPGVTLVPTMGNLHEGHLSLVRIAKRREGCVVTSIFVNPLQFAPQEDFARYPRTLERDCALLAQVGCDLVFAPSAAEMYPVPQDYAVEPPAELAGILEGSTRPAFFRGVCTVVLKLFHIVGPDAAVFGKKDYQQWVIVSRMVEQLALDIEIIPAPTIRESSGLALSSRNGYLDAAQLREAAHLHRAIADVARHVAAGRTDFTTLEREGMEALAARGWRPDYISVRRQRDLGTPAPGERSIVLGAAALGDTRLIDNWEVAAQAERG